MAAAGRPCFHSRPRIERRRTTSRAVTRSAIRVHRRDFHRAVSAFSTGCGGRCDWFSAYRRRRWGFHRVHAIDEPGKPGWSGSAPRASRPGNGSRAGTVCHRGRPRPPSTYGHNSARGPTCHGGNGGRDGSARSISPTACCRLPEPKSGSIVMPVCGPIVMDRAAASPWPWVPSLSCLDGTAGRCLSPPHAIDGRVSDRRGFPSRPHERAGPGTGRL